MSYWLGLRARIVNPANPDDGEDGVIVCEPTLSGLITIRLPDGTHTQSCPMGVKIERDAEGIEPT